MRRKLKSNTGASMILALALMLICVMVSSVILASASSGMSRSIRRTKQQQDYLAVSAASDLIVNNLKDVGKFIGTMTIGVKSCQEYNNPTTVMYHGSPRTGYWVTVPPVANCYAFYIMDDLCSGSNIRSVHPESNFKATPFGELMKTATQQVYLTQAAYTEEFTISVPYEESGKKRLPEVKCAFTMTANYDVSILVTSVNSESSYAVRIEMTPSIEEKELGEIQTITCSHMVCYKVEENGGLVMKYPDAKQEFTYEATAPEIHVTWGAPMVKKEVDTP